MGDLRGTERYNNSVRDDERHPGHLHDVAKYRHVRQLSPKLSVLGEGNK
jgi:hypothetical protein